MICLLTPMSSAENLVIDQLGNVDAIRKSRIHPIQLLVALKIYAQGRGMKGSLTWDPVPKIIDALNDAFYVSFGNVEPTGKRTLIGIDVSSSMNWGTIAGSPLTPAEGAAAMALVTAAAEPKYYIHGFAGEFRNLNISPAMRLDDVLRKTRDMSFGSTDCALPMIYALKKGIEVDTFIIYTDNETWCGNIHPVQALQQYREKTGIPAKLIVCAMEGNKFPIADPNDAGMLDVVGFDMNTPAVISSFSAD